MTASIAGNRTLTDLAIDIHNSIALVEIGLKNTLNASIKVGNLLIEARAYFTENEEWVKWCRQNTKLSITSINGYMRVARHSAVAIESGSTTKVAALRAISASGQARLQRVDWDPTLKEEAQRLRDQGLSYQKISVEMGKSKKTIINWLNPELYKKEQDRKRKLRGQQSSSAKRKAKSEDNRAAAKSLGGDDARAYEHVRKALQYCQSVKDASLDALKSRYITNAIHALYEAEDALGSACRQ